MIKELDTSKIDDVMKIWLETNISGHDFISKEYWKENYDLVYYHGLLHAKRMV